ncbi:MAG: TetR/AcrR family transcriptional regulator C-terminal domain-containing protein [Candidatus Limnocylindrales bacterium]
MARRTDPIPDPRLPLTRDRILAAAMALADAHGIESLSMRRLAQDLGVEAMSLYNHVANKDDILGAIVDQVVEEFETPAPGEPWQAAIRRSAMSAHEVLLRHPWAANLMLTGPAPGGARLGYMDALLGCLRDAGFSADMTHHAYHALDSHIMGFTLWLVGIMAGMAALRGSVVGFLEALPTERYPNVAEHIEQHLIDRAADEPTEFEFGLDLILNGLERLRASA